MLDPDDCPAPQYCSHCAGYRIKIKELEKIIENSVVIPEGYELKSIELALTKPSAKRIVEDAIRRAKGVI